MNCSALKSSDECVSLSASKMLVSPSEFSYVESDLTKILPSLEDCLTKPDQRPEVVNSSLTDRFANNSSSDAESDYLTSNHTASSDDSKDRAFLVPENSRISTPGVGVSRVVGDPDETRRLLPGVTEQRHPRPSLLTATRNTTNRPTVSANGFGPAVFEPVLSVLPQMTATASSVLPSVHADDSSEDENILPKIGTDFVGSRPYGEVGVVGCYEVSSASSDGSSGTGDRIRSSTGVSPVDPSSSFRSTSLSGYSSSCDGTDASYAAASSDRTNVTPPASNSGDEGIYI